MGKQNVVSVSFLRHLLFGLFLQPHGLPLLPLPLQSGCDCLELTSSQPPEPGVQVGRRPRGRRPTRNLGGRRGPLLFRVIGQRVPIKILEVVQGVRPARPHCPQKMQWGVGLGSGRAEGGVDVHPLAEEGQGLPFVSVEIARNVDTLTVHVHHLPAQQHLLGHDGPGDAFAIQYQALALRRLSSCLGSLVFAIGPTLF